MPLSRQKPFGYSGTVSLIPKICSARYSIKTKILPQQELA